ncbi:MAG: carboxypeptidase-like regulatory domain-containing protein, partial [Planctomycetota bacterium]
MFIAESMGGGGFLPIDLSESLDSDSAWFRRKNTSTDEDGRFQIESPSGAAAQIAVRASGFAPLDDKRSLRSMESTDLGTIQLEEGVILAGRVLDEVGQPVAGVRLRAQATDGAEGLITVFSGEAGRLLTETDEGGNFRVDKLRTGPFLIRFLHDEFPTQSLEGTAPRPGVYRTDYLVDMGRSLSIAGQVVGMPEDLPQYMKVSASPVRGPEAAEGAEEATRRYGKVQADGRFRVGGLVEGVEYKVSLREGRGTWQGERLSASVRAQTGAVDVVLEWRVDAAVELRAVHAITGEPIEEFSLEAGIDWREPLMGPGGRPVQKHLGGRARFAGLHPRPNADQLSVRIEATGFEPWERTGLQIAEGEQLNLGDVALTPVPLLVVRVIDTKTGKPIRRSNVTLTEIQPDLANSMRGGDGVQVSVTSASVTTSSGGTETDFEGDVFFGNEERELTDEEGIARFSARPGKSFRIK